MIFPSENDKIFVEVFIQKDDPAFIVGASGGISLSMIEEIEQEFNENRDDIDTSRGDGHYLYEVMGYERPQIGEEGRVEISGYWNLSFAEYKDYVL